MKNTFFPTRADINMFAFDIDGTLLNSVHEATDATCEALRKLASAGIRVVLATGRRYRDALPLADMFQIELPLVTASGALVKSPGDHSTRFIAKFSEGVLEELLCALISEGHEPIAYTDSYLEGFDFYCRSTDVSLCKKSGVEEYLHRNRSLARVSDSFETVPPAGIFAGFAMGDRDEMLHLENILRNRWPHHVSLHTIRSPRYRDWMCEFAPAGVTKWSAVVDVAKSVGIDPATICAVGDDTNDIPMLRCARFGVAMGNASIDVQAAANWVAPSHDEDGVADLVDRILRD